MTLTGLIGLPSAALSAQLVWLGAFAHVPTAYNQSALVTTTVRDGNPRNVPAGYAPLPAYRAETTVREVVRLSAAARSIRVRLSNEFSGKELRIGEAHIALAAENGEIVTGSDHVLAFAGRQGALIPAGAPLLSDPVDWPLSTLSKLAVTIFYPNETVPPAHTLYALNAWAAPGNQAGARTLMDAIAARSGNHLSEVDVVPQGGSHTVVCFGDSVTEGVASTVGAFRSWPDRLAERLQANRTTRGWSVVNAGIGSNRLLHDTPSTSALSRFDRDVLAVPGVTKVIMMLGINDIQYSRRNPAEAVSADEIMAAMGQLIARAHARGVEVIGGTITAFEGSSSYSPEGEAIRTKVNAWIRSSGMFDGVADFDAATRDPFRPGQLAGTVDSGGHLHPNDTGYAMMGDAVDLKLFARQERSD
ncbi:MAG: SGNH/GDSL hydrolase family protein [Alphaproteobacteria bacterium]|nr:SGNH/GDSL hydrolase family protein [Alphaproteobacteria bacterium]